MKPRPVLAVVLAAPIGFALSFVINGVAFLYNEWGHYPIFKLLSLDLQQAFQSAVETFTATIFIEVAILILVVLLLPGWWLGKRVFDLFFG